MELAALERPPMHLFLGRDCVEMARAQVGEVGAELEAYEAWSEDQLEAEVQVKGEGEVQGEEERV